MTCAGYRTAILDLARGVAMPSSFAAAAHAHVEACGSCRARLQRERELSAGLHALARSTRNQGASSVIERELVARFEAFTAGKSVTLPPRTTTALARRARVSRAVWTLPVAAALALGVWLFGASSKSEVPAPPASPRVSGPEPLAIAAAPDARVVEAMVPARRGSAPQESSRHLSAPVRTLEFAPVPGAQGLPAFESGHIVRVQLPLAALPSYGVEIVPGARRSPVAADLLVGQDGLARGIRLVGEQE
jgi:hypothetical protein